MKLSQKLIDIENKIKAEFPHPSDHRDADLFAAKVKAVVEHKDDEPEKKPEPVQESKEPEAPAA